MVSNLVPPPTYKLRRNGLDSQVRILKSSGGLTDDLYAFGEPTSRQESPVLPALGEGFGGIGERRPKANSVAILRKENRTKTAHGAVADYGNFLLHVRQPYRRFPRLSSGYARPPANIRAWVVAWPAKAPKMLGLQPDGYRD